MIAMRVFTVLAAIFLVGALAIATLATPDVTLGRLLFALDRSLLNMAQAGVQRYLAPWLWDDVVVPLLQRPAWLPPAALGIIFAGLAMTFGTRRGAPQSHRKRS